MGRMPRLALGLFALLLLAPRTPADDKVALRTASGRFLGMAVDGSLRAERLLPSVQETFLLGPATDGWLTVEGPEGRTLASGPAGKAHAVTGEATPERFKLVHREGNRAALQGTTGWLVLDPAAAVAGTTVEPPRAEHTVEWFRLRQVPDVLQEELSRLIRKAVQDELGGDGYDKDRIRKKQKFVKLPAPTLRDWKRQERVRVLSMDEEYHVHVQLAGEPEIRLVEMPYVQGYYDASSGAILFRIEATLPLDGRVRYKIPDALSASTGFRTIVSLSATGELRSEKDVEKGHAVLQTPKLLDLQVAIRRLDISNDALNLLRAPLEDMINEDLREKRDRIREKANRSIQKAVASQQFHAPMLEWLLRTPGM